jgi:hypothetical protein
MNTTPRIITYSLRRGARTSDEYYRVIARFADAWTASAIAEVRDVLDTFRAFRLSAGQADRSDAEYAFELLALGALLREHGGEADRTPRWLVPVLSSLIALQERWPRLEPTAKSLRGWLNGLASGGRARARTNNALARLIEWLSATGSEAQAKRLAQWRDCFEQAGPGAARALLARALALAERFSAESARVLGPYTERVESFRSEMASTVRWRYDAPLLMRTRLEYHLGLLGTEILSRAYRARFLAAQRKVVIVPPCMRAQPESECKAIETPLGAQCQHCTPTCRIHQITRLGEKHGVEVYMIPDELRDLGAEAGRAVEGLGLVGVSCALTNWGGGWEADEMGAPAQGLLLDYVGCPYHWDPRGFPTDINLRKLSDVLGLTTTD